jgi:hypothetical protein
LVQIAPTRGQNADQNPQGGDAIDDQIPHICPTPPPLWGLTLIGALHTRKNAQVVTSSTSLQKFTNEICSHVDKLCSHCLFPVVGTSC